jgi:hypothetical protein
MKSIIDTILKWILPLLPFIVPACASDERHGEVRHDTIMADNARVSADSGTGRLTPIDYNDPVYAGVGSYAQDTITKDGWTLRYFVRDDSTRYTDIYIEWSKGNQRGLFYGEDILEMRRYFIPIYTGENATHIFLKHGCATDCAAVLVLGKDSTLSHTDYLQVVDYSIPYGKVVYVSDSSAYDMRMELFAVDLQSGSKRRLLFDNLCFTASFKEQCVDTVRFSKNAVAIGATLTDVNDEERERKISEVKVARFE